MEYGGNHQLSNENAPLLHWGSVSQQHINMDVPKYVWWQPHPYGVLKINFDASVTKEQATVDYVIRNHVNQLICAVGKNICLHRFLVLNLQLPGLGSKLS